jgi:hypothetical protein
MVKWFGFTFLWALILAAAALRLWSCGAGSLPEEGSADVALFRNKCTVCHSWPHPRRHNVREWDHYLKIMETHMENRGLPIEPQEMETIRAYLHRNARQD